VHRRCSTYLSFFFLICQYQLDPRLKRIQNH
jgi:hypothetical protein